jgi:hypothetical protein
MQESSATNGSLPWRSASLMNPPYAKREQRFSTEGGRKPKSARGERSQGRPARRGTRSAQARLCERGRSGRRPRRSPGLILDSAGDSPPPFFLRERARGGDSRPAGPQRSAARKHAVAGMAARPSVCSKGSSQRISAVKTELIERLPGVMASLTSWGFTPGYPRRQSAICRSVKLSIRHTSPAPRGHPHRLPAALRHDPLPRHH